MGFSRKVKEIALSSSARHCCVCHRYKGIKMEVHHLVPESEGGSNLINNAIPLCFDCHSDAGHYNNNHPKGTKFSINELTRARNQWYYIVKENSIPEKRSFSESIQTRYFVLNSFELLDKIFKGDFSSLNAFSGNKFLKQNDISREWIEILRAHYQDYNQLNDQELILVYNHFDSIESYKQKYSHVSIIEKFDLDFPYYEAKRKVTWEELRNLFKNTFINELKKSGLNAEDLFVSLLHKNMEGCGDDTPEFGYTEYIQITPISFIFLGITNVSRTHVKLTTLKSSENELQLPEFSLLPFDMILIPTATATNLSHSRYENISTYYKEDERTIEFSKLKTIEKGLEPKLFSNRIEPKRLRFYDSNGEYEIDIHSFNLNNLYSVNAYWECGSCPHLFFISNDNIQFYSRELLSKSSNKEGEDLFVVPINIKKVVIRELEDEITQIDKIWINDILFFKDIILKKGQSFSFDVKALDNIKVFGKYIPNKNNVEKLNDFVVRNFLVRNSNRSFKI